MQKLISFHNTPICSVTCLPTTLYRHFVSSQVFSQNGSVYGDCSVDTFAFNLLNCDGLRQVDNVLGKVDDNLLVLRLEYTSAVSHQTMIF